MGSKSHPRPIHGTSNFSGPKPPPGAPARRRSYVCLDRTYGVKGAMTAAAHAGKPFRQVLAQDIVDIRRIVGTKYNEGLKDLIQYYETNFPNLMSK